MMAYKGLESAQDNPPIPTWNLETYQETRKDLNLIT